MILDIELDDLVGIGRPDSRSHPGSSSLGARSGTLRTRRCSALFDNVQLPSASLHARVAVMTDRSRSGAALRLSASDRYRGVGGSRPAPVGNGRGLLTGLVGPRRMVGDRISGGCNRRHAATGSAGSRLVVAGDHRPIHARPYRWTCRVGASRRMGDASRGAPAGGSGSGSELGGDDDRRPGGGGDRPRPRSGTYLDQPDRRRPHPGPTIPSTAERDPSHSSRCGRPGPPSARAPSTIGRGCLLAHAGG